MNVLIFIWKKIGIFWNRNHETVPTFLFPNNLGRMSGGCDGMPVVAWGVPRVWVFAYMYPYMTDATRVNSIINVFGDEREGQKKTSVEIENRKSDFLFCSPLIKGENYKLNLKKKETFDKISVRRWRKSEALGVSDNTY